MASVDINYKVTGLDGLEMAIHSLISKLEGLSGVGKISDIASSTLQSNANMSNNISDNILTGTYEHPRNAFKNVFTSQSPMSISSFTKEDLNQQKMEASLNGLTKTLMKANVIAERDVNGNYSQNNPSNATTRQERMMEIANRGSNPFAGLEVSKDKIAQIATREWDKVKWDRDDADNNSKSSKTSPMSKGLQGIIGAGLAYQAGQFGAVEGATASALNAKNYAEYNTAQTSRQLNATQGLVNSLGMAATIGGFALGGPVGGGLIGAGAATASYFTNKDTQKQTQLSQFLNNQDVTSFQLASQGLNKYSQAGSSGFNSDGVNVRTSQLQNFINKTGSGLDVGAEQNLSSVMSSARRDFIHGIKTDTGLMKYNTLVSQASLATGGDVQSISNSASLIGAMRGYKGSNSGQQAVAEYMKINSAWGGDTAGNIAKAAQIMSGGPFNAKQAEQMAGQYQYNSPMLQNKQAAATAGPFSQFQRSILMKIGGASNSEIENGELTAEHMASVRKTIKMARSGDPKLTAESVKAQMLLNAFGITGENPFANHKLDVKRSPTKSTAGILGGLLDQSPLQLKQSAEAKSNLTSAITSSSLTATITGANNIINIAGTIASINGVPGIIGGVAAKIIAHVIKPLNSGTGNQ